MNPVVIVIVAIILLGLAMVVIRATRLPFSQLVLGAAGAILGLLLGALISIPVAHLPSPFGSVLPIVLSLGLTVGAVTTLLKQRQVILTHWPVLQGRLVGHSKLASAEVAGAPKLTRALVDTSVIIDGRIADIARAGFIHIQLLVPRFILAELQNIADSDDAMRRSRGRRGLEVLNELRQTGDVAVEVISEDAPEIKEVDAKLVALGKRLGCQILTTDYNLNRVAQIEGIRVLNINELANAIRAVVLPGEEMRVKVVQPGKERSQGVGYLPDGTMIVVEQGDKLIGQEVTTEVTRVFQTVAGKMIFATPKPSSSDHKAEPLPATGANNSKAKRSKPRSSTSDS